MTFRCEIPGQPVSWNKAFRIVRVPHRGGGSHQQLAKSPEGWAYQLVVASLIRKAKPKDWVAEGQIRVRFWFRLKRAMDADNVVKILADGIAAGLDVNDARFLPCVEELTSGNKTPSITVEVQAL